MNSEKLRKTRNKVGITLKWTDIGHIGHGSIAECLKRETRKKSDGWFSLCLHMSGRGCKLANRKCHPTMLPVTRPAFARSVFAESSVTVPEWLPICQGEKPKWTSDRLIRSRTNSRNSSAPCLTG